MKELMIGFFGGVFELALILIGCAALIGWAWIVWQVSKFLFT